MTPSIGILGTGRMGTALARALLKAGHQTHVWNRTRAKAEPLAALGAKIAADPRALVAASEIIVVNVSDYQATAELLRGEAITEAMRGKLIVELTSGTPQGARETAAWAKEIDVRYLDGAILATPDFIGTEAGTILLSGLASDFAAVRGALSAFGGNLQHVGEDPGAANALDIAVLALMWGALFGTLQAIAVSKAEKIELGVLGRHWAVTAPVVQGLVSDLIARTAAGRFAADAETLSTVAPHYSAFRHLLELLRARGIDPAIAEGYDAILQRVVAAGRLQDDFAALSLFMARPA